MKVALIIGTRPEYIKMAPLYRQLKKNSRFEVSLISTGQHDQMLEDLFDFFEIKPDVNLKVMTSNQSLGQLSAQLHTKLDQCLVDDKPDMVIVQGDTTTSFVAALAAFYKKIKIIHLEAGLRTLNKYSPFPEEMNRKMTSAIADVHFCPTQTAEENLSKEGITQNTFVVGNTVIDSLLWSIDKIRKNAEKYTDWLKIVQIKKKRMILITAHRRENHGDGLNNIVSAIKSLSLKYAEFDFIIPVHLNPNVSTVIIEGLKELENVHLLPPLSYDKFVFLMSESEIILTDSGGIQEEAPSLNKPVLVMREDTERPEGVAANTSKLVGTNSDQIIEAFENLLQPDSYASMADSANPFGDGTTTIQIEKILRELED